MILLYLAIASFLRGCLCVRCYSDHTGPNSGGGIESCDADSVCSSARLIFREEGVLRKAMARQCVSRTPERSGSEWPWCTEEWAGGDEGGMEVLTCFCKGDLCNDNNFLRGRFSEWTATTMARLKNGPTHVMDLVVSLATGAVVLFFIAILVSNLPWRKIFQSEGKLEEADEMDENEDDSGEEELDKEDLSTSNKKDD